MGGGAGEVKKDCLQKLSGFWAGIPAFRTGICV